MTEEQNHSTDTNTGAEARGGSRRDFIRKAGILGVPLLLTIYSKPVHGWTRPPGGTNTSPSAGSAGSTK